MTGSRSARSARWYPPLKRVLDVTIASVLLVTLAPVMVVVAVLVRARLGSPVLFSQERPGLHGRPFTLRKFRTMTDRRGPDGALLPDEQRLPRLGRVLRATSLDELPELWNVVRGDMSLVGPRPLLTSYLDRYTPEQARRHEVRPGITGWAQVNGRNEVPWQQRFELDVWYVEHRSLRVDLAILWRTVTSVARREGISGEGTVTMQPFTGTGTRPTDTATLPTNTNSGTGTGTDTDTDTDTERGDPA
jgi:lipopolysaccharide/colanic/teichoic acid biosynthesis glycosyltransferase